MKKALLGATITLVIAAVLLSACSGSGGGSNAGSGLKRQNPPADYASATNPFEGNQDAVSAGKTVFENNCVPCHGQDAKGDGPASTSLDPKPANLQLTVKQTNPAYMHWVINVGGATAGLSAQMPSFKGVIADEDIWRIVTYLNKTYGGN